ncbi:MAG: hypothetical protein V1725_01565, partial [archaeon]
MKVWVVVAVLAVILLIPFVHADVDVRIRGSAGFDGYRQSTDVTNVLIRSTGNISYVSSDDQLLPIPCTRNEYFYECAITLPADTKEPGIKTIVVNTTQELFTDTFIVDAQAPVVSAETTLSGRMVNIAYSIADGTGGDGVCSGINRTDVYLNQQLAETIPGQNLPGFCSQEGTLTLTYNGSDPHVDVYLRSYDNVGQYAESAHAEQIGDYNEPVINNQFTIWNGNEQITRLSLNPESAPVVRLELRIDDANPVTARADISALNPLEGTRDLNCIQEQEESLCTLSGITLQPQSDNIVIDVTAVDSYGNEARGESGLSVSVVSNAGSAGRLGPPESQCDSTCFVGPTPTRFLLNIPTGSSFSTANVFFNLEDVGCGARTKVRDCILSSDVWTCTSPLMTPSMRGEGSPVRISIAAGSTDDYGNPLETGVLDSILTFDAAAPQSASAVTENLECPINGETLELNVLVTESTSTKVFIGANVSKISTDAFVE